MSGTARLTQRLGVMLRVCWPNVDIGDGIVAIVDVDLRTGLQSHYFSIH